VTLRKTKTTLAPNQRMMSAQSLKTRFPHEPVKGNDPHALQFPSNEQQAFIGTCFNRIATSTRLAMVRIGAKAEPTDNAHVGLL
jgi:hypothetical protein